MANSDVTNNSEMNRNCNENVFQASNTTNSINSENKLTGVSMASTSDCNPDNVESIGTTGAIRKKYKNPRNFDGKGNTKNNSNPSRNRYSSNKVVEAKKLQQHKDRKESGSYELEENSGNKILTEQTKNHHTDQHTIYGNNFYRNCVVEYYSKPYKSCRPLEENNFRRYNRKYENQPRNGNYSSFNSNKFNQGIKYNGGKTSRGKNENYNFAPNHRFSNYGSLTKKLSSVSQRERLEELVMHSLLECLVCYEKLRHKNKIWSCKQCYHIMHLHCIKHWAESSKIDTGWRCPACQYIYQQIPEEYRCYCGKVLEPQFSVGSTPYSCNQVCGRKGRLCVHKCTLTCHPGPCPDCSIMVTQFCNCGATSAVVKCSSGIPLKCTSICGKLLNCGLHTCIKTCHTGSCNPCMEKVKQVCYCYKQCRKMTCTPEVGVNKNYSCGDMCEKILKCGNHRCQDICHEGECKPCKQSPNKVSTCPCGKTKIENERKSCLDPILCCSKLCGKTLKCGQPNKPHFCKQQCHEGNCPPCSLTTSIKCRCGNMDIDIPCEEITTKGADARCQKKCVKKRSCGKHKCNQFCCIDFEHICPLPCNRMLFCGNHRCDKTCHKGRCSSCLQSSFEELYCECGSSVIFPPVPCGTKPPVCGQPCSRPRPCGHEPLHTCHTGPCPPCTILTKTWCYGRHEQRSTIPCYQENFSCGLPCSKPMPCGRHKCNQPCHYGPCPQYCKQPCTQVRTGCGHPCSQPCHEPPCPEISCRQIVKVTCECGYRSASKICFELTIEYQNVIKSQLLSKIEEIQRGEVVELSDIVNDKCKYDSIPKILECSDECRVIERNRRLAEALQIPNSDLQQKILPKYSDFMRQWAKKNPTFCQSVHDKLTELVQLAKQSKQKSRSYSFKSMNKEKRHFVHEYCEHFGCESVAYDPEPNRNVVATALKCKSFIPSYSLLEVIERENGQRKVPGPQQLTKEHHSTSETVWLKLTGRQQRPPTPPGEYVDYFDNPPM